MSETITVATLVNAQPQKVWDCYTAPEHIVHWNFADPSWHCPEATNDLKIGGTYHARMEAKDGSFGFDFDAIYTQLDMGNSFSYEFGGRTATVSFDKEDNGTRVVVRFEAETQNPVEMQRNGWQAILNNFKAYVERQKA